MERMKLMMGVSSSRIHDHINNRCGDRAGLKIRVVLWPQSTKTFVEPPDSAVWRSGGIPETFNQ